MTDKKTRSIRGAPFKSSCPCSCPTSSAAQCASTSVCCCCSLVVPPVQDSHRAQGSFGRVTCIRSPYWSYDTDVKESTPSRRTQWLIAQLAHTHTHKVSPHPPSLLPCQINPHGVGNMVSNLAALCLTNSSSGERKEKVKVNEKKKNRW